MRGNMYRLTFDADENVVDGGDEDEDEVEMLPCDMWEYWGLAIPPKNPKDRHDRSTHYFSYVSEIPKDQQPIRESHQIHR